MSYFKNESWRIRERTALSLILLFNHKEFLTDDIVMDAEETIILRKTNEVNKNVITTLSNDKFAGQITAILKNHWVKTETKVKKKVDDKAKKAESMQHEVTKIMNLEVKKLITDQIVSVNENFKLQAQNI